MKVVGVDMQAWCVVVMERTADLSVNQRLTDDVDEVHLEIGFRLRSIDLGWWYIATIGVAVSVGVGRVIVCGACALSPAASC